MLTKYNKKSYIMCPLFSILDYLSTFFIMTKCFILKSWHDGYNILLICLYTFMYLHRFRLQLRFVHLQIRFLFSCFPGCNLVSTNVFYINLSLVIEIPSAFVDILHIYTTLISWFFFFFFGYNYNIKKT